MHNILILREYTVKNKCKSTCWSLIAVVRCANSISPLIIKTKFFLNVIYWLRYYCVHMAEQKQGDQLEPTYSSSVRIRGAALKSCRMRWTIGRGGERRSGIPVLMTRQDDDDDDVSLRLLHTQPMNINVFVPILMSPLETIVRWWKIYLLHLTVEAPWRGCRRRPVFTSLSRPYLCLRRPFPLTLTLFRRGRLIARHLKRPFLGETRWSPRNFQKKKNPKNPKKRIFEWNLLESGVM